MSEERAPYAVADETPRLEQPEYRLTKIVLKLEPEGAAIGVEAEGCDPYIVWVPGENLVGAVAKLPEVVAEAFRNWRATQPKYPVYQSPIAGAPAAVRTTRTQRRGTTRPAIPQGEQVEESPRMF